MIYLLRTRYIDCTLLKIGYTGDNNFKKRIEYYKLHNPKIEVLYKILGGNEIDEANLHYLFKNLTYPDYGKEWFYEDQSIYNFFDTNKTKRDLDNNLPKRKLTVSHSERSTLYKLIAKIVNRWLCLISTNLELLKSNYNNYNLYIQDCRDEVGKSIMLESDVLDYLSSRYNISQDIQNQIQDFIDGNIQNSPEINSFLSRFNSLSLFREKMKLVCETELTEQERGIILDQIPLTYKNYYQTLGPGRCKALSYDVTYIEREYSDLQFNLEDLEYEIYKYFSEGSKYSKARVKETLGKIYKSLGYNKTPKANDLENYFEIKLCKVLDSETGKRDNGFEILKKKGTEDDIP